MSSVFPVWLTILADASLALALLSALLVALDEARRPQTLWIMNLVWPLTALFGSLLWLWAYWSWGRARTGAKDPFPASVLKSASHCGAGCALGDVLGEGLLLAAPQAALAFGWRSLFQEKMFAGWGLDFLIAFTLGIAFQFFSIAPMRGLGLWAGLAAALKADAASITAWQIGMFGGMAVLQFQVFRPLFGATATAATPEFWLAMQLAMLCGFAVSYPVNWLLIRAGVKEAM